MDFFIIKWTNLFESGQYNELIKEFTNWLSEYHKGNILYQNFEQFESISTVRRLLTHFLNLFVSPNFEPDPNYLWHLLGNHYLIFTLAHHSNVPLNNWLELIDQKYLAKRLILLNPINNPPHNSQFKLNYNSKSNLKWNYLDLFKQNSYWSSYWFEIVSGYLVELIAPISSINRQITNQHLLAIQEVKDLYIPCHLFSYFMSTYAELGSIKTTKLVKNTINKIIQNKFTNIELIKPINPINEINSKSDNILICGKWDIISATHPVHKYVKFHLDFLSKIGHITFCLFERNLNENQIELLASYDYFLFTLPANSNNLEGMTKFIDAFNSKSFWLNIPNFNRLMESDWRMVYFPTVGDSLESIYLSNLSLSKMQFSSYGHPVSSFGSCNTHFLASKLIETENKRLHECYSEKLILMDSLVSIPILANKTIDFESKTEVDRRIINLGWNWKKVSHLALETLQKIESRFVERNNKHRINRMNQIDQIDQIDQINKTDHNLLFQIHVGPCARQPLQLNWIKETMDRYLSGDNYQIFPATLNRKDYDIIKQSSYMAIDCFPIYGGYTTILEYLVWGIPVLVLKNQFDYKLNNTQYDGMARAYCEYPRMIMEFFNLNELICENPEQLIDHTIAILNNHEYRNYLSQKILNINIKDKLEKLSLLKSLTQVFDMNNKS